MKRRDASLLARLGVRPSSSVARCSTIAWRLRCASAMAPAGAAAASAAVAVAFAGTGIAATGSV